MRELIRVTKTGGVIRISPITLVDIKRFQRIFPELHLTHSQQAPAFKNDKSLIRYVEFKKRDLRR